MKPRDKFNSKFDSNQLKDVTCQKVTTFVTWHCECFDRFSKNLLTCPRTILIDENISSDEDSNWTVCLKHGKFLSSKDK